MKNSELLAKIVNDVTELRRILHKNPCLSGEEKPTQQLIMQFLKANIPGIQIFEVAETGLLVEFLFSNTGKTIVIRADIDALPINENDDFFHASDVKGVSHKCGHDGHAAILAGLSVLLHQQPLQFGRVVLVFQPAEETGKGAKLVLKDTVFRKIPVDFVFGFHNLPGYNKNEIVIAQKIFASASKGMIIKYYGKHAHAAYPETGLSPALAFAEIIKRLSLLTENEDRYNNFVMLTVVHANLGERAFGSAPAEAEICVTLRSYDDDNMQKLCYDATIEAKETALKHGVKCRIEWDDIFNATVNHVNACAIIDDAADACALSKSYLSAPFRWSEDFGQFTEHFEGAMFGIGSGLEHPALHTEQYDFPDEIISSSVNMLYKISEIATQFK